MTDYSSVGAGFRILILLLLVAVLVLGGLVWFDYLGIVDAQSLLAPVFTMIRGEKIVVDAEDPLLLEKERKRMQHLKNHLNYHPNTNCLPRLLNVCRQTNSQKRKD